MLYTVQPGDSLYRIALQYNTTLRQLINSNPRISNPNKIRVGQKVVVASPWGFNPWGGDEWQRGIEEYKKGIKEYRKGRAEYRKGREKSRHRRR